MLLNNRLNYLQSFQLLESHLIKFEAFSSHDFLFKRKVYSGKMVISPRILRFQVRSIGRRGVYVRPITANLRADRSEENDRKTAVGRGKER